jgi:hypothetical protein
MKGTLSKIAKQSLQNNKSRKEIMKVMAGKKSVIIRIGKDKYKVSSGR